MIAGINTLYTGLIVLTLTDKNVFMKMIIFDFYVFIERFVFLFIPVSCILFLSLAAKTWTRIYLGKQENMTFQYKKCTNCIVFKMSGPGLK